MILQCVTYCLFEYEQTEQWTTDSAAWHQLDGEICLIFSGSRRLFVSWGDGPQQYSIEQKDSSFFSVGLLKELDVTRHPFWWLFIGHELTMRYIDEDHQVLAVVACGETLYLSSQYDNGMFWGDCVRVSRVNPL